jgi:hypothetical protein
MPRDQPPNAAGNAASSGTCDSYEPRRVRLCAIATIGKSIQILHTGRLDYLMANGFDVTVVCAPSELDAAIRARVQRRLRGLFQGFRFAPIVEVLGLNGCPRQ